MSNDRTERSDNKSDRRQCINCHRIVPFNWKRTKYFLVTAALILTASA